MDKPDLNEHELRMATDVARRVAWKWSNVDVEDVKAHLWYWLCENYKTVQRYRIEEGGEPKLATALKREALRYCGKEQTAIQNGELGFENDYDKKIVSRALPYIWDYSDWHQTASPETTIDIAITILADVSQAYYSLSDADRDILAWRHRDHLPLRNIGNMLETSEDGARKRYDRALDRLTRGLGGVSAKWDATTRPAERSSHTD